jgi:hypothetical protein
MVTVVLADGREVVERVVKRMALAVVRIALVGVKSLLIIYHVPPPVLSLLCCDPAFFVSPSP